VIWLIASYLVMVFLIPLVLSALVSYRSLTIGRGCPECAGETIPIQHRLLQLAQRAVRRHGLEQRWCLECGWEGFTRTAVTRTGASASTTRADRPDDVAFRSDGQATRSLPSYRYEAGFTETLDVRTISIDGRTWRVLLQCWNQTTLCYGRLVFVEPTGRLWSDASEAFSGTSRFEVIGQALSATDGLLTSRLRRILSEA
jgi:hypothetical protein